MGDSNARDCANERDFYRRLLDLGSTDKVEPLLDQALFLIVDVTGAGMAYLELDDGEGGAPRFWTGHGCTDRDVERIRASISRGIIAKAIAEGRTVETASALEDARFEDLDSVRRHEIHAVLCAPVGKPPIGVVYLQERSRPGGFDHADRERAELFARQLASVAGRLLARRSETDRIDHTRKIRESLRCPELIGRSAALAHVLREVVVVAPHDTSVLITGPAGTGKSALAKVLANNSPRASGPFVHLNCAAIPDTLIESELFGALPGSHSEAKKRMPGQVEAAEGGTLFLDEVAELSPQAQTKLLQLLQERIYYPLGARVPTRSNVRIISATNADIQSRIEAKQFSEALYFRLSGFPIELPGLSERREDIPMLVEHFAADVCRKLRIPALSVSQRVLVACREASWPGQIRELSNAVEGAVIRAHGEGSKSIYQHHLFRESERNASATEAPMPYHEATEHFQRRYVLEALEKNDWTVAETARQLDLSRQHLHNLIVEFSLKRDGGKGRK